MKPQLTKKESVAAAFRAANIKGIDSHKRKLRDGADIGSKTSRRAQFIQKLWTMVNAPETAECVVWVDDGTAFTINDHGNLKPLADDEFYLFVDASSSDVYVKVDSAMLEELRGPKGSLKREAGVGLDPNRLPSN